jgi:hypothetical protein
MRTTVTGGPFILSRTGKARQIVLLCHGGWDAPCGTVDIPVPMIVHFYTLHGQYNKGFQTTEAVLKAGPNAYPGVSTSFVAPSLPVMDFTSNLDAALDKYQQDLQNYSRSVAPLRDDFAASGRGQTAVAQTAGGSFAKVKVENYELTLIGPDKRVRPEEQKLFDRHAGGEFSDDIDLMILQRTFTKGSSSLKEAFKVARKLNGKKAYQVFHYAPCRYVA